MWHPHAAHSKHLLYAHDSWWLIYIEFLKFVLYDVSSVVQCIIMINIVDVIIILKIVLLQELEQKQAHKCGKHTATTKPRLLSLGQMLVSFEEFQVNVMNEIEIIGLDTT